MTSFGGFDFSNIGTMPDVGNIFDIDTPGSYDIPFGTDLGLPSLTDPDIPANFLDEILGGIAGNGSSTSTPTTSAGMTQSLGLPSLPMDLFSPERVAESAARVDLETAKQYEMNRGLLNDIAYLTGESTPEFRNRVNERFIKTLENATKRHYYNTFVAPNLFQDKIAFHTAKLRDSVDDYLDTYGMFSESTPRGKRLMAQITNPSTVSIDPGVYDEQVNSMMDRFKGETKAGGLMSYTDPESQALIQPNQKYDRGNMARFYNTDKDIQGLMTFSNMT